LSKENEDGKLDDKNRRTKVLSTKLPVDQLESFNLLAECMYKNGLIEKPTPSSILRNSILDLLNNHHDDIENYRTLKRQGTANNNGHQLRNRENNQILGNEYLHPPVNDDGRTHHQGMNMAPAKESEDPQEKVQDNKLPTNNRDLGSSHIQSTQEELKEPKEVRFLGNNEQPRTEDPITNLCKLDLAKFMYTLVMVDRQNKSKLVYFEVDETTKEIVSLIPSYGLENWMREKAANNLGVVASNNN
jgi:hypothetical protein